jgi:hypothetical protein
MNLASNLSFAPAYQELNDGHLKFHRNAAENCILKILVSRQIHRCIHPSTKCRWWHTLKLRRKPPALPAQPQLGQEVSSGERLSRTSRGRGKSEGHASIINIYQGNNLEKALSKPAKNLSLNVTQQKRLIIPSHT